MLKWKYGKEVKILRETPFLNYKKGVSRTLYLKTYNFKIMLVNGFQKHLAFF